MGFTSLALAVAAHTGGINRYYIPSISHGSQRGREFREFFPGRGWGRARARDGRGGQRRVGVWAWRGVLAHVPAPGGGRVADKGI